MLEKFIQISCDGCGNPDEQNWSGSVSALRKQMRQYGWVYSKGRDYCKACVGAGKPIKGKSIFDVK